MAYHPLPAALLCSLEGVRIEIHHTDSFIRLNDPDIDESHIHNCYEIYVNVSGDVSFLVENRLYPIQNGDAVITRPGEMHLCVYNSSCIHEHFCLWIEAPEGSTLLSFLNEPEFCNRYSPDSETRQKILGLLYRLDNLNRPLNRALERTCCFLQLLSLFVGKPEPERKNQVAMPGELQRMLDYINRHFREIQHVRDIFGLFYVSPSTANRWFKKYIHLSPGEFLQGKKLACAQQLLLRGLNVSQVSLQCGFSDCSHFIAVFKQKFGETPYKYKIKNK